MYKRSKYKTISPQETVEKIKTICNSLTLKLECNIFSNTGNDYSCRLTITNERLKSFDIGVNGKGMTKDYALASAYAEFMERLQNKALFRDNLKYATKYFLKSEKYTKWTNRLINKNLELNFLYYPDEKELQISVEQLINNIIPKYFPVYKNTIQKLESKLYKSLFAPFYNCTKKETEYFPIGYYRAICGTTGLCAGNNEKEAIIQGLNEICERYVLQRIFIDDPELPNINIENFIGWEIYEKLIALASQYYISIKDCSLGMGFPVIGLLLIDRKNSSYSFKLGADFSIITALERCYTEAFQGKDVKSKIFKPFNVEIKSDLSQYIKCKRNGTGTFPHCVLRKNSNRDHFPHHDFKTYDEEYEYYIKHLKELGFEVYIKDNSFLGFSAFSVYVPGLSEVDKSFINFTNVIHQKNSEFEKINPLLDIKSHLSSDIDFLIKNCNESLYTNLQKWNVSYAAKRYSLLLKMLLYIESKDYNNAHSCLSEFINKIFTSNSIVPVSYKCLRDLLWTKITEQEDLDIRNIIAIYGEDTVNNMKKQINNSHKVLSTMVFPSCYDCDHCPITEDCRFEEILKIEKQLQIKQVEYEKYISPKNSTECIMV